MKTGIMGGTFNPIHFGHLLMAQAALDEYALDRILFIPTGLQWMKKDDPDLTDGMIRYEMTEAAIKDNPAFKVSDIEIKRPGNTYTYETMEELNRVMPDNEWYYIVGADTLLKMPNWRQPQKVFDCAVILCALRGDADMQSLAEFAGRLKTEFKADIRFLKMPRIEISSTDIRNRVRDGRSLRYMLPENVREYILQKNLYR